MSEAIKKMVTHPATGKRLRRVFVKGYGWFGWNTVYHLYNSEDNYSQLQEDQRSLIQFTKLTGKKASIK